MKLQSVETPAESPPEEPLGEPPVVPAVKSPVASPGRAICYSLAVICSALMWVGLVSPAGTWLKPMALIAGMAGLVTLCVCIVHWRW